jgi:hypothetical protein
MNGSQALKEAKRRWGPKAIVKDDRKCATTSESRKAASEKRQAILKAITPEEKKRRHRELDELLFQALRYRYSVGVHGGFFIAIRGYGDSWDEAFACADRMFGKAA